MYRIVSIAVLAFCSVSQTFAFGPSLPAVHRPLSPTRMTAVAAAIPNPFKKLPWNVKKEQERQARRMKMERAQLHRELGIAEDATYEEIVAATDSLVAAAGSDLKRKIKVEVAKDQILQIRLNERLAGLAEVDSAARAQSIAENRDEDEDVKKPSTGKEWNAPQWTQGLVVKPDAVQIKKQARIWGIITLLGVALPPSQDYLGRFTWLVCSAQLTFRGMPQEMQDRGGMGMGFNMQTSGKGHRKVAFALAISTWIFGAILVYTLLPKWARGQRWTGTLGFSLRNLIFAVACSYLQPYKG